MSLIKSVDNMINGICVYRKKEESFDVMLKRFKKKVNKSGVLKEYKDKMEYLKPSIEKKKKILESKRRIEIEKNKIEKQIIKNRKKRKEKINQK